MNLLRGLVILLLVAVALVLQVSVFGQFSWHGVVPDLVLLVVVAAGLARGGQFAMVLGFVAGALLDLTPPADHTAGRWALALLVVGLIAGMVRQGETPAGVERTPVLTALAAVAGCSFVGTSLFALSGMVLGEQQGGVGGMLEVIGISLVWDLVLTPLVLPGLMTIFHRLEPERARA